MQICLFFLSLILLNLGVNSQFPKPTPRPKPQDEFNSELKKIRDRGPIRIPRNVTRNRTNLQSNMRQTSNQAFLLNEIASIGIKISNTSLNVSSDICPFSNIVCDPSKKYRTSNGICNNVKNPLFGSANIPYKRFLSPAYLDSVNIARVNSVSGKLLPHPRTVSLRISPPPLNQRLEPVVSEIYAIFGQFLIHDLSGTSATTDSNGLEIDCSCGINSPDCLSLPWPANDPVLNQKCMKLTRSSASPDLNCGISYREQVNLLSAFIDGTAIYGMDDDRVKELRAFSKGLLKTSEPVTNTNQRVTTGTYLPLSNDTCSGSAVPSYKCFLAGEFRTSENLALVSIHTLFNREHNRIAGILATNNPSWSDENLYQETRRIIIGILQHIVYKEWLPMLIGDNSLAPLSNAAYFTGYNSSLNPTLYNEFSTAAFRFGHSLIRDRFSRFDNIDNNRPVNFSEITFKSDLAYDVKAQGLSSLFKGIVKDTCWRFGSFGFELQNRLFGKTENNVFTATDLLATNILRGRDHGLQPYIKYVKLCHGIDVRTFADLDPIMNRQEIANLQSVYENVADIDLYAGGLMERKKSNDHLISTTFGCLVMKQFAELKKGDRFFYENGPGVSPNPFDINQLSELKKVTMAGLICNNYDFATIQSNAFLNPLTNNPTISCSSIKNQIDLSKWTRNL